MDIHYSVSSRAMCFCEQKANKSLTAIRMMEIFIKLLEIVILFTMHYHTSLNKNVY